MHYAKFWTWLRMALTSATARFQHEPSVLRAAKDPLRLR